MNNYYTLTEVARMLGIKYFVLSYQHRIGKLSEPIKAGGRRAYSHEDIRRVAAHFGLPAPDLERDETRP